MRPLVLALAALSVAMPARAQEPTTTRVVKDGYAAGFRDCAPAVDKVVRYIHESDEDYGYVSTWATEKPNGEMLSAMTSEAYTDGQGVTTFMGTKTASGVCDIMATQTLILAATPCATLLTGAYKTWKLYTELNGVNVYEDPEDKNTSAALVPIGKAGCVVVKHVMGFGVK
jgi:hypothetical protein